MTIIRPAERQLIVTHLAAAIAAAWKRSHQKHEPPRGWPAGGGERGTNDEREQRERITERNAGRG
jgi:hypothetical protein